MAERDHDATLGRSGQDRRGSRVDSCPGRLRRGEDDPALGVAGEPLIGSAWIISDTGDVNADGMDDILRDDAGKSAMVIWLMNGTDVLLAGPEILEPEGP